MLSVNGINCATKAQTLAALRDLVALESSSESDDRALIGNVIVLDQRHFTLAQWQVSRSQILDDLVRVFQGQNLIVRSSAIGEDGAESSLAGAFGSFANIPCAAEPLAQAIDSVIASYGSATSPDSEVLVQPMATDIAISGVIFSREMNTGANYFSINYDDFSGETNTVTGGQSSKVFYIRRSHHESIHSHRFYNLAELTIYLEKKTKCPALDIEFGIDGKDRIYLFQLRPLTLVGGWDEGLEDSFHASVDQAFHNLTKHWVAQPALYGRAPLFSDMADWNPAEILGGLPSPLASSIYRKIITQSCWARARAEMGYRDLASFDLMLDLCGKQFIDVRLSLNSFLPRDVDPDFGASLVDFQLQKINANRHLHDKLEFDVAITCTDFSFHRHCTELVDGGLDRQEVDRFSDAVLRLTREHIQAGAEGLYKTISRQKLNDSATFEFFNDPSIETLEAKLDKLITVGTLPFSILARHGFIGVSMLRSMVKEGMLTAARADAFMSSVETITSTFVDDLAKLSSGTLARTEFLSRYGHLRPGTYDIRSLRYDEAPDFYLSSAQSAATQREKFSLTDEESASIAAGLSRLSIDVTPAHLIEYMATAIQLRENSKFHFTRHLSNMLLATKTWGAAVGLTADQLAYVTVQDLLDHASGALSLTGITERADAAALLYKTHQKVKLPAVITEPDDVNVVRVPMGKPNFITQKHTVAPSIFLKDLSSEDLEGRIVLIESADPGFDWLFTHPIAGLVTKYGGANSHMAIRCAEFAIPAAIGCGDRLFDEIKAGGLIELNCASQTLRRAR